MPQSADKAVALCHVASCSFTDALSCEYSAFNVAPFSSNMTEYRV